MKYNKFYIGLTKNGIATNPVVFRPRKSYVYMHFYRIKDEEEYGPKLDAAGLTYDYFTRSGELRVLKCFEMLLQCYWNVLKTIAEEDTLYELK